MFSPLWICQILVLSFMLLCGLHSDKSYAQSRETALDWLRQDSGQDTVIVFVHGFRGDKRTWLNEEEVAYWPQIVKDDPAFNGANVAIYRYPSDNLAPDVTIEAMARFAQTLLDDVKSYKNIVFVAHSMGGYHC